LLTTDANKKLQSVTALIINGSNIGVDFDSPNERLTVNGVISLAELASAPSASANFGKVYVNGSTLYYKNSSGTEYNLLNISPAGSNTEIQFNNSGSFGASSNLTWDGTYLKSLRIKADNGTAASPSYSFNGDTNTGIFSPGADSLAIATAGQTRLTIDSSGNLGIGTTSPGVKFELNGTLAYTPSALANIVAGTGITVTNTIMKVQGSGGAVDITANPQIVAGVDGQIVIIKGSSDSNTVLLENGTGLILESASSMTLGNLDTIRLIYDQSSSSWIELSRSDN
jgi:hypothetical protein